MIYMYILCKKCAAFHFSISSLYVQNKEMMIHLLAVVLYLFIWIEPINGCFTLVVENITSSARWLGTLCKGTWYWTIADNDIHSP